MERELLSNCTTPFSATIPLEITAELDFLRTGEVVNLSLCPINIEKTTLLEFQVACPQKGGSAIGNELESRLQPTQ